MIYGQFHDTYIFIWIVFVLEYGTCRRFTVTLFAYTHTHVYFSKRKLLNICVILRLAVLAEHRLVTDRHRQTYEYGMYRASMSSRGKQEGQHPLTGQRAANFRRDLEAT